MIRHAVASCLIFGLTLTGCATVPPGPTVPVMPAPGKPFELFQVENEQCKEFARQQVGKSPSEFSNEQVATGAAAGALLGAATGALMGHGHPGAVATGAGLGLLGGSLVGASSSSSPGNWTVQQRYDVAYQQCMYAKGNQISGYATQPRYVAPPATQYVPPPATPSPVPPPPPPPPANLPPLPPPPPR